MIRTGGQCVVEPKDVCVEVKVEGQFVTAAEGLAEVGAVGFAVAAEVAVDAVGVGYRHS